MKAIRATRTGGPEVLELLELEPPRPAHGEILVAVEAAGVNFIDIYQRSGVYPLPLPLRLGHEGAGTVIELGPNTPYFAVGDRVAWCAAPGSYASHAIVAAEKAVPIPATIDSRTAAAAMLQGLTAHYLTRSTHALEADEICLIHAGAGGVGLLLTQIAKHVGAKVVSTVSTDAKAELARAAGADEVVIYTRNDFVEAARRASGGRGVHVAYDGVGQTTFDGSLRALAPRGLLVLFGQASGAVPPVDLQRLNAGGSLYVTRPSLVHYTQTRTELLQRAAELWGWIERGTITVRIGETFSLVDASKAHAALASRATTGKLLLLP